jgi:hypothetical protein
MALTKDEAITRLRKSLNEIITCRRDWDKDYPDVIYDIREIARQALEDTNVIALEEHSPERSLADYINRCEDLIESKANWEFKYDLVFQVFSQQIRPLIQELGIRFDYYDPDTSYEEDTMALMNALRELKENLKRE